MLEAIASQQQQFENSPEHFLMLVTISSKLSSVAGHDFCIIDRGLNNKSYESFKTESERLNLFCQNPGGNLRIAEKVKGGV